MAKYIIGMAQVLLGQGPLAGRIAASAAVFLGGVVLFVWLRTEVGWATGILAAGLWLLTPRGVTSGVRMDRFALLEPFMVFFAITALAAAWMSYRRQSWLWTTVSAIALALSVTSKVTTVVLLPIVLALPFVHRKWRAAAVSGLLYCAVFGFVFVVVYLPLGLRSSLSYMLKFQGEHDSAGHLVVVAGSATMHPPWWANLLFTVDGVGVATTTVLAVGTIATVWSGRTEIVGLLASGLALLAVFYLGISKVALPHYYYAWMWPLCALAGLGIVSLWSRRRSLSVNFMTRSLVVTALVLVAASSAWVSVSIWNERPSGMALVQASLIKAGATNGDILVGGMADWEYAPYLSQRETADPMDDHLVAVAVKHSVRFPLDPTVAQAISSHSERFEHISIDDVELYILHEEGKL